MKSLLEPSMRMPTCEMTWGGVQMTAPSAPPMADAVNLSRRDLFGGAVPISRDGTAT